jgi:membrane protease subunit HflC
MKTNLSIIVLFLALIVTFNCFYVVDMTEHVLITYFGKPVRVVSEPGLKVKGPFLWKVNRLEKRTLEWDGYASQIPTRDKKYIWIDTYARWRVVDPLEFFQAVRNERAAQSRLDDIIDGATRDLISQYDLIELVRNSNREMAADESGTPVTVTPIELGRDQIATKIRQRRLIAELLRSEGRRNLEEIEGTREKELNRIRSEAYETAQGIRGQADSLATRVYADAMGQDPEFYSFVKTLESYAASLKGSSTLILSTDSAYLSYLKDLEPRP